MDMYVCTHAQKKTCFALQVVVHRNLFPSEGARAGARWWQDMRQDLPAGESANVCCPNALHDAPGQPLDVPPSRTQAGLPRTFAHAACLDATPFGVRWLTFNSAEHPLGPAA